MKTHLKPCPFCGGKGEMRSWEWPYLRFQVRCSNCKATPRSRLSSEAGAAAAWNRRVEQAPVTESLTTEQAVNQQLTTEQPEGGPVAWMACADGRAPGLYIGARPPRVADGCSVQPLYPESVKAERDALRVDLDRSKARTDRAINEIRALREKVGQLEYSNAVNADAKAQAGKHAEEADRLRERVKGLVGACEALKSDLLDRADTDSDGLKVVDVSHGKWERFKAALAAMQEGKS